MLATRDRCTFQGSVPSREVYLPGCTFWGCTFKGYAFQGCTFHGVYLLEVYLPGDVPSRGIPSRYTPRGVLRPGIPAPWKGHETRHTPTHEQTHTLVKTLPSRNFHLLGRQTGKKHFSDVVSIASKLMKRREAAKYRKTIWNCVETDQQASNFNFFF